MNNNEYSYTRMPWGKYKGRYLKEIPEEYLLWAANSWQDQATALMFKAELAHRKVNWADLESKLKIKHTLNSK